MHDELNAIRALLAEKAAHLAARERTIDARITTLQTQHRHTLRAAKAAMRAHVAHEVERRCAVHEAAAEARAAEQSQRQRREHLRLRTAYGALRDDNAVLKTALDAAHATAAAAENKVAALQRRIRAVRAFPQTRTGDRSEPSSGPTPAGSPNAVPPQPRRHSGTREEAAHAGQQAERDTTPIHGRKRGDRVAPTRGGHKVQLTAALRVLAAALALGEAHRYTDGRHARSTAPPRQPPHAVQGGLASADGTGAELACAAEVAADVNAMRDAHHEVDNTDADAVHTARNLLPDLAVVMRTFEM